MKSKPVIKMDFINGSILVIEDKKIEVVSSDMLGSIFGGQIKYKRV